MADEINLTLDMNVDNGSFTWEARESISVDQTDAQGGNPGTVTIAVDPSITAIDFGDLDGSEGYAWMRNLDSANYVWWGPYSGGTLYPVGKLKAGEIAIVRLYPTVDLRMSADTAEVDVYIATMAD